MLLILNKYIQNINDINLIYEKISQAKVRKNTNNKFDYDYSCDIILIIKNILLSIRKKNGLGNNINEIKNFDIFQTNEFKNFVNEIYNDFFNFYKLGNKYDNTIFSFNLETGHINFKIPNKIKTFKSFNIEQNKKGKNNINDNKIQINNIINKINNINISKEKYNLEYFKEIVTEPEIYFPLKHKYTIELTNKITLDERDERFYLYKKYQSKIHNETDSVDGYNNFIGVSPLDNKLINLPKDLYMKTKHPEFYPKYYGMYNLIHRIDGKIIAVTVIDILPNYFESLYCYYDPDFSFLDLGIVTAIREIEYMKSFQELIDKNLIYYTMGEMSLTVTKLKYKGDYSPTEIMDNYTGIYVPLNKEIRNLISDNECHCLTFYGKNKNKNNYFSKEEIDYLYYNITINVFGDKILIEDFLNLYLEDNLIGKTRITYNIRKFIENIDIETFSKINFYYDNNN